MGLDMNFFSPDVMFNATERHHAYGGKQFISCSALSIAVHCVVAGEDPSRDGA